MKKTSNSGLMLFIECVLLFTFFSGCIWIDLGNPILTSTIFGAASVILVFIYGFRYCNNRFLEDSIHTIVIILGAYYIFIYVFGLVCGFYHNRSYNSNWFITFFLNLLEIFVLEFFRYIAVSNSKRSKLSLILISIVLTLCDVSNLVLNCNLNDISDSIELFGLYVIPSLFSNISFTYICLKSENYKPILLYRIIIESVERFVPIIPNTGLYIQSILNIILPIILFFSFYSMFRKRRKIISKENYGKIRKVLSLIIIFLMIVLIMLVSSIFKYFIAAVGSGSMEPTINTGDAILVKKLDKDEIKNLNIGDILVYKKYQNMVVHRIVTIIPDENELLFVTKGDHNNDSDNYVVSEKEVVGTTIFRIPFIGLPTIWLVNQSNF